MAKRAPRNGRQSKSSLDNKDQRELIAVMRHQVQLRTNRAEFASLSGEKVSSLQKLLKSFHATLLPLFGDTEDSVARGLDRVATSPGADELEEMVDYYSVAVAPDQMDDLAEAMANDPTVEAAYVKPAAEPPMWPEDAVPSADEPPSATPDFTGRQIYLNAAPAGINARYAWTRLGGRGAGIRIIDIEGAWRFTHEDLLQNQGGLVGGVHSTDLRWRNHGTAVLGEYSGDRNSFGVTGICPDANASAVSIFPTHTMGSARAIRHAADRLRAGDILLLELHRPGPRFNFQQRDDQRGYIAIEWWPDDYDAIRYAVARGILVVEAAGNGAEDLDASIYSNRPAGFPTSWRNPFQRGARDSGAIVVGAGAPPPGTHGRNHGPDRSRLGFSNYGSMVDAQGWGREVTTTGYGDLQGGTSEDRWYTDTFSGTSSASPIVVGALGCIQGVLRAHRRTLLTPASARAHLRATGSPQQDAPGRPATQRIGNRPDLRQSLVRLVGPGFTWRPEAHAQTQGDREIEAGAVEGPVVINVRSGGVIINIDRSQPTDSHVDPDSNGNEFTD